jgi:hypothetical protein
LGVFTFGAWLLGITSSSTRFGTRESGRDRDNARLNTTKGTNHDSSQNKRYQSWLAAVRFIIYSPA